MEKQEKFEKQLTIAKAMGLDFGEAKQDETMPNGNSIQIRDELGLHLDPTLYAKRSCSDCYGRGVLTQSRPISTKQVEALLKDDPRSEGLIHYKPNGAAELREKVRCSCAKNTYLKKYKLLVEAFVKAGIK